ncbi:hypothetical protein HYX08_03360 [Candidatus Woesearchaeota archaeon]|nr:hypothetical protein [Candidatus Woesearchaeota archaeon]
MAFDETYFGTWHSNLAEVLKKRAVRDAFPPTLRSADKLEGIIRQLDLDLQRYALEWQRLSDMHKEYGTYRKIVEFIGEPRGLLIDLGSGNGNFLAEWGDIPSVGVDLNGYCLQLAETNLRQRGLPVVRYSKSSIMPNPEKGLDILPLEGDLHLDQVTLLTDDITELRMTKQVLEHKKAKADIVTCMLWGGRNVYETIHFLDQNAGSFDYKSAARLTKYKLMDNLPAILKSGGRFYLAMRMHPLAEQISSRMGVGTMEEMFKDLAGGRATLTKLTKFPLRQETGLTDINIRGISGVQNETVLYVAEYVMK